MRAEAVRTTARHLGAHWEPRPAGQRREPGPSPGAAGTVPCSAQEAGPGVGRRWGAVHLTEYHCRPGKPPRSSSPGPTQHPAASREPEK